MAQSITKNSTKFLNTYDIHSMYDANNYVHKTEELEEIEPTKQKVEEVEAPQTEQKVEEVEAPKTEQKVEEVEHKEAPQTEEDCRKVAKAKGLKQGSKTYDFVRDFPDSRVGFGEKP